MTRLVHDTQLIQAAEEAFSDHPDGGDAVEVAWIVIPVFARPTAQGAVLEARSATLVGPDEQYEDVGVTVTEFHRKLWQAVDVESALNQAAPERAMVKTEAWCQ